VAQEFETLVARERRAVEEIRIDAVWNHLDPVVRDAQDTHGLGRVVGRNADDAPAAPGRRFESRGPVLSVAVSAQIRPPQQLAFRFRQSAVGRHLTRLDDGRKPVETRAQRDSHRVETPDAIEHLQIRAVQMGDERALGPKPSGGLMHRRQVMEMNDVDVAEACALEHALPRPHLSLRLLRAQSRKDRIRRSLPILEGAMEWNRPHELILTAPEALKSGRVVRDLDAESLEEGGSMRLLPERAERPGGKHNLPTGLHERAREIPGNLRRTAARVEHQAHSQASASPTQNSEPPASAQPCRDR